MEDIPIDTTNTSFFVFKLKAKLYHENKHSLAANLGLSRQDPNFPREILRQKTYLISHPFFPANILACQIVKQFEKYFLSSRQDSLGK